jgi:hypothetical protein
MSQGQKTGLLLMAGSVLQLLVFLHGVSRRSYLALALPVTAAMAALTALIFWLGLTMLSSEDEPESDG